MIYSVQSHPAQAMLPPSLYLWGRKTYAINNWQCLMSETNVIIQDWAGPYRVTSNSVILILLQLCCCKFVCIRFVFICVKCSCRYEIDLPRFHLWKSLIDACFVNKYDHWPQICFENRLTCFLTPVSFKYSIT